MKKPTFIKIIQTLVLTLLFCTIVPIKPISADSYIAYSLDSSGKKVADYTNISDAIKATRENGYKIVMSKDWEVSSPIDIVEGTSATIEMNGHKIKRIGIGEAFILHSSSTLNLLGNMASNTTFNFKDNTNGITKGEVISGGLITNGNVSGNNRGVIFMKKKATLNLTNVAVAGNLGSINGAAIYVDGASCIINMNNAKVNYNKTSSGAGVYSNNDNTSIYLENNSEFCYNTVTYHGAAVFFNDTYSSLISKDGTGKINHNSSSNGTVYLAEKYDEIKNVTFDSNSSGNGGAIFISSGNNHIDGCTITNNIATHDGGGIFMAGDAIVKDTTITNNTCNTKYYDSSSTNYDGGGVSVGDYIDITLVGTVIIKDNKRINGSSKGYTEDDVYLGTDKAYIRAQSLSSDSIVGIRTANTNDVRIVKNLYSFNYGHVFFLDLADRFHFSYESKDKVGQDTIFCLY